MGPPHPPLNPFGSSSFTHTYSFSSSASALASTVPIVPIPITPQKVSQSVKGANTQSVVVPFAHHVSSRGVACSSLPCISFNARSSRKSRVCISCSARSFAPFFETSSQSSALLLADAPPVAAASR